MLEHVSRYSFSVIIQMKIGKTICRVIESFLLGVSKNPSFHIDNSLTDTVFLLELMLRNVLMSIIFVALLLKHTVLFNEGIADDIMRHMTCNTYPQR